MAGTTAPAAARGAAHRGMYVRTPLLRSEPLSRLLGRQVWLKLDNLQHSGSFKLRGMSLACLRAREAGAKMLVSSSGGNAGLAVAHAGRTLGMPTTVCLPTSTPAFIRGRLEAFGAKVVVEGSMWSEANAHAERVAEESGGVLMHPFDMPDAWDGHASLVHEIREDLGEGVTPGMVIASVGGGGLLMGVLQGLQEAGWGDVPVLAVETEGADALAQALRAGKLVTLPEISSVAKSLGADCVSEKVFQRCQDLEPKGLLHSWVTSDSAAVRACQAFADDHRMLVEPACGASLAAVYERAGVLLKDPKVDNIVVEVCGGGVITSDILAGYVAQLVGPAQGAAD